MLHLFCAYSQHPETERFQQLLPLLISRPLLPVDGAVYLNNKGSFSAIEIDDKRPERVLSTKLVTIKPSIT